MCFVLPRFFIDLSRSYNYFFCASASFSISFTAAASMGHRTKRILRIE